jgi:hypothetical protein
MSNWLVGVGLVRVASGTSRISRVARVTGRAD